MEENRVGEEGVDFCRFKETGWQASKFARTISNNTRQIDGSAVSRMISTLF